MKVYPIHTHEQDKSSHDIEIFENEQHEGKFKLLISEGQSIAPALDGAYWLTATDLFKLGIRITALAAATLEKQGKAPEISEAFFDDAEKWAEANGLDLKGGRHG